MSYLLKYPEIENIKSLKEIDEVRAILQDRMFSKSDQLAEHFTGFVWFVAPKVMMNIKRIQNKKRVEEVEVKHKD